MALVELEHYRWWLWWLAQREIEIMVLEFVPFQKRWKSDINSEEEVPLLGYVLKVRHKKVQRLQLTLGPSSVLLLLLIIHSYVRTERLCNLEDGEWRGTQIWRTSQIETVTGVRFLMSQNERSSQFPFLWVFVTKILSHGVKFGALFVFSEQQIPIWQLQKEV